MAGIGKKLIDVSELNEKWVYSTYPKGFSKMNCAELSPDIFHQLRDYNTLTNAFTLYDGLGEFRNTVMSGLNAGSYCFGYYADDEFGMVESASRLGISMLPSDVASNLSSMNSIYVTDGLKQRVPTADEDLPTETDVHYVTFLLSDGDNIAYNLWSQQTYFSNPVRGSLAMGYTISPSLYDLAPAALRWYYEKMTPNDYFVCGPSGSSYIFPSKMPAEHLDPYLVKLNEFTGATGLKIVNILDKNALNNMALWEKYLAQPNIDAILYTGYGESPRVSINFASNGKPVICQTDNLWENLMEENAVISRVNARPTDITQKESYSLVFVHTWTKNFNNVKQVVEGFNPNVRVVTPDVFVKLIQKNIAH